MFQLVFNFRELMVEGSFTLDERERESDFFLRSLPLFIDNVNIKSDSLRTQKEVMMLSVSLSL